MKKEIAIASLLGLLGTAAWAFMPFTYGGPWNVNELDVFPQSVNDINAPSLIILGSQLSTGQYQPSIRSYEIYPEPAANGRAFEMQIGDAGSFFWSNSNNSIWAVQNGTTFSPNPIVQADIYGNIGPPIGFPNNNRMLFDRWFNLTPVDGDFSWSLANSLGNIEIANLVYTFSTDGVAGTQFTFSITDGFNTCSASIECSQGTTVGAFVSNFGGGCDFSGFSNLTISFSDTGNCVAVPVIRSLYLYHVYTNGP